MLYKTSLSLYQLERDTCCGIYSWHLQVQNHTRRVMMYQYSISFAVLTWGGCGCEGGGGNICQILWNIRQNHHVRGKNIYISTRQSLAVCQTKRWFQINACVFLSTERPWADYVVDRFSNGISRWNMEITLQM